MKTTAQICWSFAKLSINPREFFDLVKERADEIKLVGSVFQISSILYSFASLGLFDTAFFESVIVGSRGVVLEKANNQDVSNILWALVTTDALTQPAVSKIAQRLWDDRFVSNPTRFSEFNLVQLTQFFIASQTREDDLDVPLATPHPTLADQMLLAVKNQPTTMSGGQLELSRWLSEEIHFEHEMEVSPLAIIADDSFGNCFKIDCANVDMKVRRGEKR